MKTHTEEFYTTLYPDMDTLDTSTAPTYKWKRVTMVSLENDGTLWPMQYKFMPRKQKLKIKLPSNFKGFTHQVRVCVEVYGDKT